jgi:hypothetical protein
VLGGVALLVRVLVVLGQPLHLFSDDADYQRLAVSLATGHGWGISHVAPGGGPTAFRPPMFPLMLAGLYKVVGVHLLAARLLESVLGAGTVVLLVVLTWILWNRTVALIAGAIAAIFPPLILASTSLMSESLALPLEVGSLLAIFIYRRSGRIRWAVLSGGLFGLLVLTRTEAVVLVLPLALLAVRKPVAWRAMAAPAALLLAALVVLTPWELRDKATLDAWVPLTTQSGYVLSGTYNQTSATAAYPGLWRPPNFDRADEALIASHPHANEVELDHLLQSAALHYASNHPSYVITVFAQNTLRMFDFDSLRVTQEATYTSYGYPSIWGDLEAISGIAIVVLAVVGLFFRRARRRIPVAYWLVPVILWISTVLQEALPRMRAMIDPFLIQLAAVAIVPLVVAIVRQLRTVEFVGLRARTPSA